MKRARPLRLGLWIPWALFVVLALGWIGYRAAVAGEANKRLDAAIAEHQAKGGQAGFAARRVTGFPLRLTIRLDGAYYAPASLAWRASCERLEVNINLSNPQHLLLRPLSALQVAKTGAETLTIAPRNAQASVRFERGALARFSVVANAIAITDSRGAPHNSNLASLVVHARPDPRDAGALQVPLEVTDWVWPAPPKGFEGFGPRLATARAGFVIEKSAQLAKGPPEDPLSAWVQAGGRMRVENGDVVWGPAKAKVTGALLLDTRRRPEGALAIEWVEPSKAIDALAQSSYLSANGAAALRLAALGQSVTGTDLQAQIIAREGWWRLGPFPVLPAKPLGGGS
jgi:hypothetical protein